MLSFIKNLISHMFFTSRKITRKAEIFKQKREERYIQFLEIINSENKSASGPTDAYGSMVGDFLKEMTGSLGIATTDEIDQLKVKIDLLNKKLDELSRKP